MFNTNCFTISKMAARENSFPLRGPLFGFSDMSQPVLSGSLIYSIVMQICYCYVQRIYVHINTVRLFPIALHQRLGLFLIFPCGNQREYLYRHTQVDTVFLFTVPVEFASNMDSTTSSPDLSRVTHLWRDLNRFC